MLLDELVRLHEHAARPAARVVHHTLIGLDELGDQLYHAGWRVELAILLGAAHRKRLKEILVHAPDEVFLVKAAAVNLAYVVDKRLHRADFGPQGGEQVKRQSTPQRRVLPLGVGHGLVDLAGDVVCRGIVDEVLPARLTGQIEDVGGVVEGRLFQHELGAGVNTLLLLDLCRNLGATRLELVACEL